MAIIRKVFLTTIVVLFSAATAVAMPITVPSALNVGDQYRLVFMTSTTTNASSTNIADYNAFVTAAANASGLGALGTTWTALGSTATVDARDNTNTNPASTGVAIYNLGDQLVASNNADLWDGTLGAAIDIDENGVIASGFPSVFTGTTIAGIASSMPLGGDASEFNLVEAGFADQVGAGWTTGNSGPNFFTRSVYAISDVLTVQATIPEPGAFAIFGIGIAGLMVVRRRRRHCK